MIYRIDFDTDSDMDNCHGGFEWFRNYRDAVKRLRERFDDDWEPGYLGITKREGWRQCLREKLMRVVTPKTKGGLVDLLNKYGAHPDNG